MIHVSAIVPTVLARFLGSELAAEMYVDEILDGQGNIQYLDKVGSVSGLIEIENDFAYDPTHIELNHVMGDPHGS